MRDEFERWAAEYPSAVAQGDEAFAGSPTAKFVTRDLPAAIGSNLPGPADTFILDASAGQGGWTHTPWVALLDPAVTRTVQAGEYVVYLLSADGKRLFLSLNQGCTALKDHVGIPEAEKELRRRADLMRRKVEREAERLKPATIHLVSRLWRARLYEAGNVFSAEYDTSNLPGEATLISDLHEALRLYRTLRIEGGYSAEDSMLQDAKADGLGDNVSIEQAKRYRQHKHIERDAGHARLVKKLLGTRCMGCDHVMSGVYGPLAEGLIHAHHLA